MTILQKIGRINASLETATRSNEFISIAKSLLLARGRASDAAAVAPSERVAKILKGAVAGGQTSGTGWAEEIAAYNLIAESFVGTLAPFGSFDFIMNSGAFRRMPMHTRISMVTLGASGSTVAEAAPKPITKLELAGATLQERKSVGIIVISDELLRSAMPVAFSLLGDELRRGLARPVDSTFLDLIADDTNLFSTSSTGLSATALIEDIGDALLAMDTGATSRIYAIMPPSTCKVAALLRGSTGGPTFPNLRINGGDISGITVVPSDALTDTIVIVDAAQCAADVGPVVLDASEHAAMQLDTAPSDGAQNLTSLWQRNLHAIRASRYWAFELLHPTGAATITGVSTTA